MFEGTLSMVPPPKDMSQTVRAKKSAYNRLSVNGGCPPVNGAIVLKLILTENSETIRL
jgi:hypothetical protein